MPQQNRPDLSAVRGKEPAKKDDPIITDPVNDDLDQGGIVPPGAQNKDGDDPGAKKDDEQDHKPPAGPPTDDARNKIFNRMAGVREEEVKRVEGDGDGQADGDGDAAAGAADQGDKTGADNAPKAETFDLVVNGKTVTKNIAELADLADMTVEEIKAKPETAKRFAQRELATRANLDRSKEIVRTTSARPTDDEDAGADPARSSAPNQGDKTGKKDGSDQQDDDDRDTNGAVDFQKLVEDIQIGDPKDAAEKLRKALEQVADQASEKRVSRSKLNDAILADAQAAAKAGQEFFQAHDEVKARLNDDPEAAGYLRAALTAERTKDLRKALVAEGIEQEEAEQILRSASPEQVAEAHRVRRISGSPHVRLPNKQFFEDAYKSVSPIFGKAPSQQQQQEFRNSRDQRKENLRPQPQRSSVPPAERSAEKKPNEAGFRKTAFEQMEKARGGRNR